MSGRGFDLKDYATVDDRITRYWELHPKPEGSIQTEITWVSNDGNSVAIKATVYMGDRILATGIAQEERGKTFKDGANFTSWWENCETSAIGRALANMDMSLSKRRPSRQEMTKVRYGESAEEHDEDAQPAPDTPRPSSVQPRPAERAQQAPQPFSAGEYEDLIKKAWSFVRIDQYAEAIRVLRESRERMTTDQMDDTKEELKRMKAWTPEGATAP